jgi:hypothetical protein
VVVQELVLGTNQPGRSRVLNFFLGSHSRPADRIRNMEAELLLNYQ